MRVLLFFFFNKKILCEILIRRGKISGFDGVNLNVREKGLSHP